jgi:cystathionine gamma-synthase
MDLAYSKAVPTMDWENAGISTKALHAGQEPDALTGAVVPPVYLTSTFKQDGVGHLRGGYEYSRTGNPTRTALENALAAIETPVGAPPARAFAFASGMAAEDTLLRTVLRPGDHVLMLSETYGGTFRLLDKVFRPWGVEWDAAGADYQTAIQPGVTKVVWIETPSNPTLHVVDIAAVAAAAHQAGALVVVDNTFATPYLQNPTALGADVVVHSTTKYIGGHSDVVGGALVVVSSAQSPDGRVLGGGSTTIADAVAFHQNSSGTAADPFAAWLTLRGLKTLAVRLDRHLANAAAVVELLQAHPKVEKVYYPGLAENADHEIAARQMRGYGGMVAFQVASEAAALELVSRTKLFTLAESLGGAESLIEHPGRMTHASVAGSMFEVPNNLVRLSVGIEDQVDLLNDLEQALTSI